MEYLAAEIGKDVHCVQLQSLAMANGLIFELEIDEEYRHVQVHAVSSGGVHPVNRLYSCISVQQAASLQPSHYINAITRA